MSSVQGKAKRIWDSTVIGVKRKHKEVWIEFTESKNGFGGLGLRAGAAIWGSGFRWQHRVFGLC